MSLPNTLRIGQRVMWRGSWGTRGPQIATVIRIERTNDSGEKYGTLVDELPWSRVNWSVVTLDNGHWSYGTQIEPIDQGEAN